MDEAELIAQGLHDDRQERIAALEAANTRLSGEVAKANGDRDFWRQRYDAAVKLGYSLEAENTLLRMRCADLADELIWLRRGGTVPLAHNHAIEGGPEMYERNAPCPRCEQIKGLLEKQFADAPGVDVTAADNASFRQLPVLPVDEEADRRMEQLRAAQPTHARSKLPFPDLGPCACGDVRSDWGAIHTHETLDGIKHRKDGCN